MPAIIKRVDLNSGKVYQSEKPWPEGSHEGQFVVGPIFFVPEHTESFVGEKADGEEEEDVSTADTEPAHYEVWRMPRSLIASGPDRDSAFREALEQNMHVTCRWLFTSGRVTSCDYEWPVAEAFQEMSERFMAAMESKAQPETNGQQRAPAVAQP